MKLRIIQKCSDRLARSSIPGMGIGAAPGSDEVLHRYEWPPNLGRSTEFEAIDKSPALERGVNLYYTVHGITTLSNSLTV